MALVAAAKSEFSSREKTLDLLRKRIEGLRNGNRQNVAVIGRKYAGKSTLLLKFFYEMLDSREVVPVYLELREEPFHLFEKRFIDAVLDYFRIKYGHDFEKVLPESHPEFYDALSRVIRSSRRSQEQALSSMFGLLSALREEAGMPVVLILDEFQKLSCFRVKNPYSVLGEKIMTQKDVLYLVSSSAIKRAKDILDNDLSLLFGNFEVHELGHFSAGEALFFVGKNFPGLNLPPELSSFLLSLTGNNPFYLESILSDVQRAACLDGKEEIQSGLFASAVANQLHNPASSICRFFLGTVRDAQDFRSAQDFEILLAAADGAKSSAGIAKAISKSSSQTTRKLEKFIAADILMKYGQVYDYADPLLKLWIKLVYKQMCFSPKPVQAESFRHGTENYICSMYSSFLSCYGINTGERVRGLFSLFENDAVELAGRSVKLPKFTSVGRKRKNEEEIPVFASAGRRVHWALDYTEESAVEADIIGFLGKLSDFPKTGTRIFLCFDGIEADARLLAKEKAVWLWSLRDLNILCDIYEQPRIMLKEKSNG